ncbi:MAG TPA: HupE/UreJ family protein [Steroidobacteraceae bacterium]|nr:HupE/UreJ family protein [Steroidobacteraceae bacterium]
MRRALHLLLLLLAPLGLQAHTGGSAFLNIARGPARVFTATWDVDLRDLQVILDLDADHDGALTWREVQQSRERIAARLQGMARLAAGDAPCVSSQATLPGMAEHGEIDLVRATTTYACAAGQLQVDSTAAMSADPSLRILLTFEDGSDRAQAVALNAQSPRWQQGMGRGAIAARFLYEGVRHLLTGYDHLAFLVALLIGLVMRPRSQQTVSVAQPSQPLWRSVLRIVTAFTLAHSLTLALAATGIVRLPSAPVEAAIAASIIAAALFNLVPGMHRFGWQLAFGFGLVHGFGFAGALSAMASRIDLVALASFNLGIELAQLACAALLLPLLYQALRPAVAGRHAGAVASVGVALLAGWWLLQRLPI